MLKKITDVVARIKSVQNTKTNFEFAKILGMTPQTVDLYLKGERKPSLEFVIRVCKTFSVSSDWLLGLSTDVERSQTKGGTISSSHKLHIRELKTNAEKVVSSAEKLLSAIDEMERDL